VCGGGLGLGVVLGCTVICTSGASQAVAQPAVVDPGAVIATRQWSETSSDWSVTQIYDLDQPVEIAAVIEGLNLPDGGNAELLFRADEEVQQALQWPPGLQVYHATLQTTEAARKQQVGTGQLKAGSEVLILGWPALPGNGSVSRLLVDQITVKATGKTYAFHEYQPMKDRKAKAVKPPKE
jgi:hypothetical protein